MFVKASDTPTVSSRTTDTARKQPEALKSQASAPPWPSPFPAGLYARVEGRIFVIFDRVAATSGDKGQNVQGVVYS